LSLFCQLDISVAVQAVHNCKKNGLPDFIYSNINSNITKVLIEFLEDEGKMIEEKEKEEMKVKENGQEEEEEKEEKEMIKMETEEEIKKDEEKEMIGIETEEEEVKIGKENVEEVKKKKDEEKEKKKEK
jgi:hypothetical protein